MNETPTTVTSPEIVFAKQLPLALQALGIHMEANALPPFLDLNVDRQQITVHLYPHTAAAWLTTVDIDHERAEERHLAGEPAMRHEYDVRLPETGFRFTLLAYRPMPAWKPAVVS